MSYDVSVIGLGYIGLPTAAMFASRRLRVIGVDVNSRAVETINRGEIHIVEPDLDIAVHAAVTEGYLHASVDPEPADAFLIAVPTPFTSQSHEPDLTYIAAAARAIAPVLRPGNLVVLESTSPVGATEQLANWLAHERPDLLFPQTAGEAANIHIAYCPERVLPGRVMQELIQNDRVIGGMTKKCSDAAVQLYKKFVEGECVVTNARTAEMAKLTENSFRDVNIAFANELSIICERFGIDVWELISLANRHPRVNILSPGPGVGGHCIAVDPWFIVSSAPQDAHLIRTARLVNDRKPEWVLGQMEGAVQAIASCQSKGGGKGVKVACYGLTFKPDIDDIRESPSLEITRRFSERHDGEILVVEPNLITLPKGLERATLTVTERAAEEADIHIFLVAHSQFRNIPKPDGLVIDACGLWQ